MPDIRAPLPGRPDQDGRQMFRTFEWRFPEMGVIPDPGFSLGSKSRPDRQSGRLGRNGTTTIKEIVRLVKTGIVLGRRRRPEKARHVDGEIRLP
jgi:hypothetical protein